MYRPCFAGAEAAIWLIACFCHADGVPAGRQDKRQLVCTLATRPRSTPGACPTVNVHKCLQYQYLLVSRPALSLHMTPSLACRG